MDEPTNNSTGNIVNTELNNVLSMEELFAKVQNGEMDYSDFQNAVANQKTVTEKKDESRAKLTAEATVILTEGFTRLLDGVTENDVPNVGRMDGLKEWMIENRIILKPTITINNKLEVEVNVPSPRARKEKKLNN